MALIGEPAPFRECKPRFWYKNFLYRVSRQPPKKGCGGLSEN